jgi:hypothetical protein
LYLIQLALPWKWEGLYELQLEEGFKRWSGLVLFIYIGMQWFLTTTRITPFIQKYSRKVLLAHKWMGAVTPLLFYIHSMDMGYGYLFVTSLVFLTNTLIGIVNLEVLKSSYKWIFNTWMILHVAFSLIITFGTFVHIFIVFYYH